MNNLPNHVIMYKNAVDVICSEADLGWWAVGHGPPGHLENIRKI